MRIVAGLPMVIVPGREPFPVHTMPVLPPVARPVPMPVWKPPGAVPPVPLPRLRVTRAPPPAPAPGPALPRLQPELRPVRIEPPPVMRLRTVAVAPAQVTPPAIVSIPGYAREVGLLGSGQTKVSMTPADLMITPRTDITQFTIITIDAGQY